MNSLPHLILLAESEQFVFAAVMAEMGCLSWFLKPVYLLTVLG